MLYCGDDDKVNLRERNANRKRDISNKRQEEIGNKKEEKMGKGLDRCCILSQQMVELEGKRVTRERKNRKEIESHLYRIKDEDEEEGEKERERWKLFKKKN